MKAGREKKLKKIKPKQIFFLDLNLNCLNVWLTKVSMKNLA